MHTYFSLYWAFAAVVFSCVVFRIVPNLLKADLAFWVLAAYRGSKIVLGFGESGKPEHVKENVIARIEDVGFGVSHWFRILK